MSNLRETRRPRPQRILRDEEGRSEDAYFRNSVLHDLLVLHVALVADE